MRMILPRPGEGVGTAGSPGHVEEPSSGASEPFNLGFFLSIWRALMLWELPSPLCC